MDNGQTGNRRAFLQAATAFTIVPRHVLGGAAFVPPSDKITLAMIGTGTQGLREMPPLLLSPQIRMIAVADPSRDAVGYRDWSKTGLLNSIRQTLNIPNWRAGQENVIPGGRMVGKDLVDAAYGNKDCKAYADFREMLDKEKDLDAVKIMTPDHIHAPAAAAAMRRGKHVMTHKPLSNRLVEAYNIIEMARKSGVATHFSPYDANGSMEQVMGWIRNGEIGTLKEVHNWTNRPVWPQFDTMPTEQPPIPEGFDWDLWLGPEAERPYSPNYTHMVFRGWYDFGGGSMADMGHYSLWTVFNALELSGPTSVEPLASHHVVFNGDTVSRVKNDFSFPAASVVTFKYPAKGSRPAIDLVWYEGGMRPRTPDEVAADPMGMPLEGMMFVGDRGKIIAGFHVDNPRLVANGKQAPFVKPPERQQQRDRNELPPAIQQWIKACRGGSPSPGNFTNAWPISEAVNLYAVALRSKARIEYDAATRTITRSLSSDAPKYLARQYRKGWDPQTI